MNKRVGEIEEFGFGQLLTQIVGGDNIANVTTPQLDITIALTGWIKDEWYIFIILTTDFFTY